ncbi:type II toxin-antitoxin system VapC family toxin [Sphingomonas montana]|uniref:type II toxin-antitoxin system VapC family toxin n=1 Tax=Sphingomonas montana TaxID=1843236 RepID=UPI00096CBAE0|nr:type II toxin-antitoxin system VapC family toxin [Sphingomonas montana]
MRAVDTNVLARFLLRDDPAQYAIARNIVRGDILVPATVLVELSWLLLSTIRLPRLVVHTALLGLVDMTNVHMVDEPLIRWALARFADGADFADTVHMAVARDATSFLTFDHGLAERAGSDAPLPVEILDAS